MSPPARKFRLYIRDQYGTVNDPCEVDWAAVQAAFASFARVPQYKLVVRLSNDRGIVLRAGEEKRIQGGHSRTLRNVILKDGKSARFTEVYPGRGTAERTPQEYTLAARDELGQEGEKLFPTIRADYDEPGKIRWNRHAELSYWVAVEMSPGGIGFGESPSVGSGFVAFARPCEGIETQCLAAWYDADLERALTVHAVNTNTLVAFGATSLWIDDREFPMVEPLDEQFEPWTPYYKKLLFPFGEKLRLEAFGDVKALCQAFYVPRRIVLDARQLDTGRVRGRLAWYPRILGYDGRNPMFSEVELNCLEATPE